MKISIVYWSMTGNTESMAKAMYEAIKENQVDVELLTVGEASSDILNSSVILFGCPAMGAEVLEESEFEPFFESIENQLNDKKVGLFGSYDWGDGEWMRNWQERTKSKGAKMIADGLIIQNDPDNLGIKLCQEFALKAVEASK